MTNDFKPSGAVILGGGDHAKVLVDALITSGGIVPKVALDLDSRRWGQNIFGVPIIGDDAQLLELREQGIDSFIVGVGSTGNSHSRRKLYEKSCRHGMNPLGVQHAAAICSSTAELGKGVQLLAGAIVNSAAKIGDNVLINTGAIIEHDCRLADHVHVATGARLAGRVLVGRGSHIGIGATIRQGIRIGDGSIVGAGAVVVKDVPDGCTVVGVPAHILRRNASNAGKPTFCT